MVNHRDASVKNGFKYKGCKDISKTNVGLSLNGHGGEGSGDWLPAIRLISVRSTAVAPCSTASARLLHFLAS